MLPNIEKTISPVQNYFAGTCIFITGATGFLGKLTLEKILRTCTDVKKVIVLIREKKGKSVESRLEEILSDIVFNTIKKEQPTFYKKIWPIKGDCTLPGLGLSEIDAQTIIEEVNCVFHLAATVRFDEHIRTSAYINIRATRDLIQISKNIKRLKSFLHMSTAFSNCNRNEIDEKVYKPSITGEQLLAVVDNLDDNTLDQVLHILLGSWPNTYTFTKALAEETVWALGQHLPVAIVRPSIVLATANEPVAGWSNSLYGAHSIIVGVGLGIIHSLHCRESCIAEVVPADYVINCAICAAWNVGTTFNNTRLKMSISSTCMENYVNNGNKHYSNDTENHLITNKVSDAPSKTITKANTGVPIYNYVSSIENPITWGALYKTGISHLTNAPLPLMMWYSWMIINPYRPIHNICIFLFHKIPAYVIDFFAKLFGKEPTLRNTYDKVHKLLDAVSHFVTHEWQYQNDNTKMLWNQLSAKDKKLFHFDVKTINWNSYVNSLILGMRIHLLHDSLESSEKGRMRYLKLKVIHYVFVTILLYLLYKSVAIICRIIL